MELTITDRALLAAVAEGLPLVPAPYHAIGAAMGLSEAEVRARLANMAAAGVIKRLGVIVRHRALGYTANAMVVWDVADRAIGRVAAALAGEPTVTLCYRRPRHPPNWPYALFCMIHGRDRAAVRATLSAMIVRHGLEDLPHAVLFSGRCFVQRGARYTGAAAC
ncbi:MAG: AsnC family transcriptional regulator [Alphaproteobacteria bacterium]|nr:AsnC family transcriptional regulator [Alphaproteobacteria bacterium]